MRHARIPAAPPGPRPIRSGAVESQRCDAHLQEHVLHGVVRRGASDTHLGVAMGRRRRGPSRASRRREVAPESHVLKWNW